MRIPAKGEPGAEAVAAAALAFLAGDAGRLGGFLAITGVDPADIRRIARERAFLAAVLDYVVADEPLLLAFAEDSGTAARAVVSAQVRLSGPSWERDTA